MLAFLLLKTVLCRRRPQTTMGNNGFGNFGAGHTTGAGLFHQNFLGTSVMGNPGLPQLRVIEHNRALETMGSNGKQWIW